MVLRQESVERICVKDGRRTLSKKKSRHWKGNALIKERAWGCLKGAFLFVAISVGGGLVNAALAFATPCEEWVAKLVSVEGMIETRSVGEASWEKSETGDTYCLGDTVRVPQWRAALVLKNETVIRLDAGSELTFTEFKEEKPSWIELLKGMVHFLSRTPQRLTITTPFVNGTVEGTEFLIRVKENEAQLWVSEGRVLLDNELGMLPVVGGQSAVTHKGEAPQRVIVVRPRDAVQWALYYPPLFDYRAAQLSGPDAPTLLKATQRYEEGEVSEALSQLDTVPPARRDVQYFNLRASMLLSIGRVDQAQADIAEALNRDTDNGVALALSSVMALVNNDTQEALRLAHQAVERAPDSSIPHVALSYAQQATFQIVDASASAQEATRLAPEDALARARMAELWLALGYSGYAGRAIEAAEQAVELNAKLSRSHTILGFAHLGTLEIEKAATDFQRALALDQADPLPRLGLGLAKIRHNDLEAGRREIETATALDPNNSILRSYLGKSYFEEKRDGLAETQYDMAKELDPHDPTPWFYDAIRKQLHNQPIDAFHDLQESIRLNDNRAVYRGRLLLDEDVAARGATVGRIFDNLGFEQRGRVEGWYSLSRDPASPMAHRLLSDMYSVLPRFQISRVSELLQTQLLQPLNTNNLQPQLPFSNLQIFEGAGPSTFSLNEFNPMFMREGHPRLLVNTIGGNNETYGGSVVGSILHGPMSLSGGAFRYWSEPDFRDNFDVQHTAYNVFAQVAFLPQLNVQAEYRYRKSEFGDLVLNFDPKNFNATENNTIDENIARVGVRFTPGPHSDIIGSYIYSQREQSTFVPGPPSIFGTAEAKANQVEGQYLFRSEIVNAQIGGGYTHVDNNNDIKAQGTPIPLPPFCFPFSPIYSPPSCLFQDKARPKTKNANGYVYVNVHWPPQITWTGGFAYESINDQSIAGDSNKYDRVLPKAGMQWNLTDWARLRLSYVQTVKRPLVANQTIEPTQVAGFNQLFDDANGTIAEQEGVALDLTLTDDLYAGFQLAHRELKWPVTNTTGFAFYDRREDRALGYVYWAPHPQLAFKVEGTYERFKRTASDPTSTSGGQPIEQATVAVPLSARFFHPSGFFAGVGGSFVWQKVDLLPDAPFDDGTDKFFLVDANVGYRLPKRFGIFSLEVRNLFDTSFHYQDLNAQTAGDPVASAFLPTRMVFARLTLSF
ncbi:MAG TPA: TonB-dependent receptor [Nitrospirales bacterium]|nr:TonB-dependent receptor [Nitrospiraceae bacterium]HNP31115.1 TonB-dependent receptor [Nitrospirales bacterium]